MKLAAIAGALALWGGAAAADIMADIAAKGSITLGYRVDAPPFSYRSELGEPTGLAVSLCKDAAKEVRRALKLAKLDVVYKPVTAATRFEELQSGGVDLHCGPTTATLARRVDIDFSIPYFVDGSSVVFRAGPVETIDDLNGLEVGVLRGTTTEEIAANLNAERGYGYQLRVFETHVEGLTALADGAIAAYFGDQAILRYQLGELRPRTALKFSDNQFSFEPYALAMRRGESRLRLAVDRALSRTFASGLIYTHINAALGEVQLSDLALAVYQVVTLPE